MENKHMKKMLSTISEKCKLKLHEIPPHMSQNGRNCNTDNSKCGYECGATGILIHCWWGEECYSQFRREFTSFHKLTIVNDLADVLLVIDPSELKTCPHKILNRDVYSSFIYTCQILESK